MRYVTATQGKCDSICIGRQGENKVVTVQFDVSGWQEMYGSGSFSLLHQRSADMSAYPCVITSDTNTVSWVITSTDVFYVGNGRAQLLYIVDDKVAKSVVFTTNTLQSLNAGDAPEPEPEWIADVVNAGLDAEAYAIGTRNGADVPSDDPAYRNNSKYFAELAASAEGRNKIYWATDNDTYDTIRVAVDNGLLPVYMYNVKPSSSFVDQSNRIGLAVYSGVGYDYQANTSYVVLRDYYGIFPGFYSQYITIAPLDQVSILFYKMHGGSSGIVKRLNALYTDNVTQNVRQLVTSRGVYDAINKVGQLLISKGLITQAEWDAR